MQRAGRGRIARLPLTLLVSLTGFGAASPFLATPAMAATSTSFSPTTVHLTAGQAAMITIAAVGLAAGDAGAQFNVVHTNANTTISNAACVGIFAGANPTQATQANGDLLSCTFVAGGASGTSGNIMTFTLTNTGGATETLSFNPALSFYLQANFTTTEPLGTVNTLAVTNTPTGNPPASSTPTPTPQFPFTATATAPDSPRSRPLPSGAPASLTATAMSPGPPGLLVPPAPLATPSPTPAGAAGGLPAVLSPLSGPPTPGAAPGTPAPLFGATEVPPSPAPAAAVGIRAPANLRVLSSGPQPGMYTLTWDPSDSETVTEYRVRQVGADGDSPVLQRVPGSQITVVLRGDPAIGYSVVVAAVDTRDGESAPSNAVTTAGAPTATPIPPPTSLFGAPPPGAPPYGGMAGPNGVVPAGRDAGSRAWLWGGLSAARLCTAGLAFVPARLPAPELCAATRAAAHDHADSGGLQSHAWVSRVAGDGRGRPDRNARNHRDPAGCRAVCHGNEYGDGHGDGNSDQHAARDLRRRRGAPTRTATGTVTPTTTPTATATRTPTAAGVPRAAQATAGRSR